MTHKIIVVGIGPGDPAYLLPKAQKTIENARILVGGKRALADYSHSGARECVIGADIPGVLTFIREVLTEDDVVVMVSGDPGYYSLLDALRRTFPIGLRLYQGLVHFSWHLRDWFCRGTLRDFSAFMDVNHRQRSLYVRREPCSVC